MAASGGQDQVRSHLEDKVPEKQGLFGKVKDTLNFTKHLGFISDVDSPANQAALAEVREKEEREGVTEEVPLPPLSERLKQGVTNVANTASVIATGASGGVAPRFQELPEQSESEEEAVSVHARGHPELDVTGTSDKVVPGTSDKRLELRSGPTPKDEEKQHKHTWVHRSGPKEQDPQAAEKEDHNTFSKWAVRTAHKLGDVVASKDLTDDPSSKKKPDKK